jgi:hypothetical protein
MPGPPINPPTSDFEKYEGKWEAWLDSHYDKETNTIFGLDYSAQDIGDVLYDRYWEQFMKDVVYPVYDI